MNPITSTSLSRRLSLAVCLIALSTLSSGWARTETLPNFVVIFADDLGYGDLACYGHPTIATPHLDRMAAEGMRFTEFYSAASVCTPSRAAIMTGRLPIRSGMCSDRRRVLFPDSAKGLPESEITLAEALKTKGYATAAVGKWHLGHLKPYLPTSNGFDSYFGIPYSNDMDGAGPREVDGQPNWRNPRSEYWNVPLMRDEEIIERPADQTTITHRYTMEAVNFIRHQKDKPFFLYLAHNLPHIPLFASDAFLDTSRRGLYGDVIEEIDWSVGQVLQTLRDLGLEENTLVFFTSDNGPWLPFQQHGGSAGLLREGKGSTWDGGMREPGIAWWPGRVKTGAVNRELCSTMDIFTTCLQQAGVPLPEDRVIDGRDLSPMFGGLGKSGHEAYFFYRGRTIFAVRKGPWKAHYWTRSGYRDREAARHDPPLLFHLGHDPSEKYNIADQHPDVLKEIESALQRHQEQLKPGPDQLAERISNN